MIDLDKWQNTGPEITVGAYDDVEISDDIGSLILIYVVRVTSGSVTMRVYRRHPEIRSQEELIHRPSETRN